MVVIGIPSQIVVNNMAMLMQISEKPQIKRAAVVEGVFLRQEILKHQLLHLPFHSLIDNSM